MSINNNNTSESLKQPLLSNDTEDSSVLPFMVDNQTANVDQQQQQEQEYDDDDVDISKFKEDDDVAVLPGSTPGSPSSTNGNTTTENAVVQGVASEEEEKLPPASCGQLFRFATAFDLFLIFIGTLASLAMGLMMPLSSVLMGNVLNDMQDIKRFEDIMLDVCFYFFAFGIISLIAGVFQQFCFQLSAERQARALRVLYLRRLFSQKMSFHDKGGEAVASKLSDYTTTVANGLGDKLGKALAGFASFIFAIVLACTQGAGFAGMLLIPLPLFFIIIAIVMKRVSTLTVAEQKAYAKANQSAQDSFENIKEVHVFQMHNFLEIKYSELLSKAFEQGKAAVYAQAIAFWAFLTLMFTMYAYGIYIGGIYFIAKHKTMHNGILYNGGHIIAIFYTLLAGFGQVGQMMPSLAAIAAARGSMAHLLKVIDHQDDTPIDPFDFINDYNQDYEQYKKQQSSTTSSQQQNQFLFDPQSHGKYLVTKKNFTGSIKFVNVTFSYPSRPEQKVLDNFSFHFENGKQYGLVGRSGCGKSSLLSLIQRLYDPQHGEVMIEIYKNVNPLLSTTTKRNNNNIYNNNKNEKVWVNLKDIYIGPWRRFCCGVCIQEPMFMTGSIADNIKLGRPEATKYDIITVSRIAEAHNFIMKKPSGYNTLLQQNISTLSGGESARVGLARTLLMRPALLLLDEYSASLDYRTEYIVSSNLNSLYIENNMPNINNNNNNDTNTIETNTININDNNNNDDVNDNNNTMIFTPGQQKENELYHTQDNYEIPGSPHIRTVIAVAHRLVTVRNSIILALNEGGKLDSFGTHDELMQNQDSLYYKLYTSHPDSSLTGLQNNNSNNGVVGNNNNNNTNQQMGSFILKDDNDKLKYQDITIRGTNFVWSIDAHIKDTKKTMEITRAARDWKMSRLVKDIFTTHPILMFIACCCICISGSSFPGFSYIFGHALKALYEPDHDKLVKSVTNYALLFLAFAIIMGFVTFLIQAILGMVGEKLVRQFRMKLYSNILKQEIGFFDRDSNSSAQLTAKLAKDTTQIRIFISQVFNSALSLVAQVVISFIQAYTVSPTFTWIMMGIFPFSILSSYLQFSLIRGFAGGQKNVLESSAAVAIEAVKNIRTLIAFNAENLTFLQFAQLQSKQMSIMMTQGFWSGIGLGIAQGLFYICQAGSYYFGGKLVIDNKLEFYEFFQIYQVMRFASQQFSMLLSNVAQIDQINSAISDMYDLCDRESLIDQYYKLEEEKEEEENDQDGENENNNQINNNNNNKTKLKGTIQFHNVHFHYPTNRSRRILKDVSFKTAPNDNNDDDNTKQQQQDNGNNNNNNQDKPGYHVSLVASTGHGKSTILQLILKFYSTIQPNGNERLIVHNKDKWLKEYYFKNKNNNKNNNNTNIFGSLNSNTIADNNTNNDGMNDLLININDSDNNNTLESPFLPNNATNTSTTSNNGNNEEINLIKKVEEMSPDELFLYRKQQEKDFEYGGQLRNPLQSGFITLNGKNIQNIKNKDLYNKISIVFQNPKIFRGTVLENILCGLKVGDDITMERVYEVTKQAQIYDFIMKKLPNGFDTLINDKNLSGGQKTRLTIARALIRSPEVLLLDEVLANLDAISTKRIEIALNNAMKGRVCISIVHRLESIVKADNIIVLKEGQIVEQGKYNELLNNIEKRKLNGDVNLGVFATFLDSSAIQ